MLKPENIEHKKLMDIILRVAQLGDNNQNSSENVQKILSMIAVHFNKVNSIQLETIIHDPSSIVNMANNDQFIYLPPIEKGGCFVPILCIEFNYSEKTPEAHFRFALFYLVVINGEETLKSIGYRFETPHKQENHRYYHIQHINQLGEGSRHTLPNNDSTPLEYPAFPIDAQNPIELILCLLIGLYDIRIINQLGENLKNQIESNFNNMRFSKFTTKL